MTATIARITENWPVELALVAARSIVLCLPVLVCSRPAEGLAAPLAETGSRLDDPPALSEVAGSTPGRYPPPTLPYAALPSPRGTTRAGTGSSLPPEEGAPPPGVVLPPLEPPGRCGSLGSAGTLTATVGTFTPGTVTATVGRWVTLAETPAPGTWTETPHLAASAVTWIVPLY